MYTLKDMNVVCYLYGGSDFQKSSTPSPVCISGDHSTNPAMNIKSFILDKMLLQLVHPHHNQEVILEVLHTVLGVTTVDIRELQSQRNIRRKPTRVECLTGKLLVVLIAITML